MLPSILDGLADEAEGVRDAALAAGRTLVDLYAETALPLLLPAVEDGILNDNWRIRQSSVELLGQLLFKVSHCNWETRQSCCSVICFGSRQPCLTIFVLFFAFDWLLLRVSHHAAVPIFETQELDRPCHTY